MTTRLLAAVIGAALYVVRLPAYRTEAGGMRAAWNLAVGSGRSLSSSARAARSALVELGGLVVGQRRVA